MAILKSSGNSSTPIFSPDTENLPTTDPPHLGWVVYFAPPRAEIFLAGAGGRGRSIKTLPSFRREGFEGVRLRCTCEPSAAALTRARLTRLDSEPPHGSSPPAGAVHFGTVQSFLPRRKRSAPERGPSGAFTPIGANVLCSWSTPPYRAQRARPARDRRRCYRAKMPKIPQTTHYLEVEAALG